MCCGQCGGYSKPDTYTVVPTLAEVREQFPALHTALDGLDTDPDVKGEWQNGR